MVAAKAEGHAYRHVYTQQRENSEATHVIDVEEGNGAKMYQVPGKREQIIPDGGRQISTAGQYVVGGGPIKEAEMNHLPRERKWNIQDGGCQAGNIGILAR